MTEIIAAQISMKFLHYCLSSWFKFINRLNLALLFIIILYIYELGINHATVCLDFDFAKLSLS
jgi:hypothetical protein